MEFVYVFTSVLIISQNVGYTQYTLTSGQAYNVTPVSTSAHPSWLSYKANETTERSNGISFANGLETLYMADDFFNSTTTLKFIENRLNSIDTIAFLSTFKSDFERNLVRRQLKSCPFVPLCEYALIDPYTFKGTPCCVVCSCEIPKCHVLGTCCLDLLLSMTRIEMQEQITSSIPENRTDVRNTNCVPMHLAENKIVEINKLFEGALMYDSCPTGTNLQLFHNCTREYTSEISYYRDILPVMNILNGVVYRNIYCAYCNNAFDEELVRANIILTCIERLPLSTERNIIKVVLEGNVCDLSFEGTEDMWFEPCTVSISKCNTTGHWLNFNPEIERACGTYQAPIAVNQQYYKNVFCAMCNGAAVDEFECQGLGTIEVSFTFSGLLKLETGDGSMSDVHESGKCSENQLYDYIFKICREIVCSPLTSLNHGKCYDTYTVVQLALYTVYLKISPLEVTTLTQARSRGFILQDYLRRLPLFRTDICGVHFIYHISDNYEYNATDTTDNITLEYYKFRLQFLRRGRSDPREMYEKYILLQNSFHTVTYFDFEVKQLKVFKTVVELVDLDPKPFDLANILFGNNKTALFKDLIFLPAEIGHDVLPSFLNAFNPDCSHYSKFNVNVLHLNRCPKVLLEWAQFDWERTDNGIRFQKGKFNVKSSDIYFDLNGDIMICANVYSKYISQLLTSINESISPVTIVSLASSLLSIASLIFTLVVFILLPRLRKSFPGKINISLVLVLLCAQCLYLISSMSGFKAGTLACIAVGIMLHFFWLLSLMWMNVCTYHMFHVLTRMEVMSLKFGCYRFMKYHLYAIIMSVIPVVINISVSSLTSDSYGYGVTDCYISSQDMVVYTFGIPVFVIILCNMSMYFIMVFKIRRAPSVRKNVKNERNDLVIFTKLSTVTGATWIFGFIYSWTDIIVLSYLFILFNGGQGVFIMFSLLHNRRVMDMFRSDVLGQSVMSTDDVKKTSSTSTRPKSQ